MAHVAALCDDVKCIQLLFTGRRNPIPSLPRGTLCAGQMTRYLNRTIRVSSTEPLQDVAWFA
jgi:hypothetical protein